MLLNNGSGATTVTADGAFTLSGTLAAGASYAVTVGTQPTGQSCTVSAGSSANMATSVTSVNVSCLSIGRFIDAPVAGLAYTCSSPSGSPAARSGSTDAQGQFEFAVGQGCTFKVGNVTVGSVASVPGDNIVTPQDLAGVIRSATASPAVLAIAQFLQSLDDGSAAGTLTIPASAAAALNGVAATPLFSNTSGVLSQPALLAPVRAAGKQSLVSPTAAAAQLQQELNSGRVKAASGAVTASSPVTLSSVVITGEASLAAGLRGALTATGHYSDGSTKDLTASATWSSTSAAVATVSAGSMLGVALGSATITAQAAGVTGTASVQVGPPVLQALSLSPASPSVVAGRGTTLVLTGTYSDGSKGTALGNVNWSSSMPSTASVDGTGRVTGAATGSATITAAVGGISTSLQVNVLEPEITSIVISAVSNAVQVGSTLVLNALANLSNDTQKNVTALVTWVVNLVTGGAASEATAVATITTSPAAGTATLTGTGQGTVTVVASSHEVRSNTLNVEVEPAPPIRFQEVKAAAADISEAMRAVESKGPSASTLHQYVAAKLWGDTGKSFVFNMNSYPDGCDFNVVPTCVLDPAQPYVMRSRLVALRADSNGVFRNATAEVFGSNGFSIGAVQSLKAVDINGDGIDDFIAGGNQDHMYPRRNSDGFGQSVVLLSDGRGGYTRHELGPRGFYETVDLVYLDPQTPVAVFAANNYENAPAVGESPTPAFKFTAGGWTDLSASFIQASAEAGCCGRYLSSAQFIPIPVSTTDRTTQAIIDTRNVAGAWAYRLWVRGSGETFQHVSTLSMSGSRTIPVIDAFGNTAIYPVIEFGGVDYIYGGYTATCKMSSARDGSPLAVAGVSLWRLDSNPAPTVLRVVDTPGGSPFDKARQIQNLLIGLSLRQGKLVAEPLSLPGMRNDEGFRFKCLDFDGDGRLDIVDLPWGKPNAYLQQADGSFRKLDPKYVPDMPPPFGQAEIGDFNADGVPDLIYVPTGVKVDPAAQAPWAMRSYLGRR